MTDVLPFKPRVVTPEVIEPVVDKCVIKMLEFYLEKAKAGQIRFAGLAIVDQEGVAQSTWAPLDRGPAHTTQALGSVAYLNARFNQAAIDGEHDADQWIED